MTFCTHGNTMQGEKQVSRILTRQERIDSNGLGLHVEITGEGPPVVLLHGFPENGHSWRHQAAALASARFSAWVPNLRGYPPSDISPQRDDYRLRLLVDDVAEIVAATGRERATVVGHDWGGIIAWAFAGAFPDMLDKLVIINAPHMQVYAKKVWWTSQLFRSAYVGMFQLPFLPEQLLSAGDFFMVRQMFKTMPARRGTFSDEDIDCYIEGLSQPGALKAALDYYRANMSWNGMALAREARTEAPVLMIWGERDPALGTMLLEGVVHYAPRVRIHRMPHAGHWAQNEFPEEVNREILAFLR